jgi:hypothetical protein
MGHIDDAAAAIGAGAGGNGHDGGGVAIRGGRCQRPVGQPNRVHVTIFHKKTNAPLTSGRLTFVGKRDRHPDWLCQRPARSRPATGSRLPAPHDRHQNAARPWLRKQRAEHSRAELNHHALCAEQKRQILVAGSQLRIDSIGDAGIRRRKLRTRDPGARPPLLSGTDDVRSSSCQQPTKSLQRATRAVSA